MENNGLLWMGPVATLDSAALVGRDYLDCFSDAERRDILGARNSQRRQERVAGRLAAKFLFLSQPNAGPSLIHLTPAQLDRYTARDYSSAEVFRNEEVNQGLPRISNQNTVALSHTNGLACAFLGSEKAVAIDMERAEPRTPTFYQGNFTAIERSWATDVSARLGLQRHWTFTFLWTIKECLLKTPWFRDLSIADLPSMNVQVTSGEEQLIHPHSARGFLAGFVFLQADVTDARRTVHVNLALSGRHDLVLTALQRRVA
jgi:hypothetical protein